MEQKNNVQELSLDEMDKVSGGAVFQPRTGVWELIDDRTGNVIETFNSIDALTEAIDRTEQSARVIDEAELQKMRGQGNGSRLDIR